MAELQQLEPLLNGGTATAAATVATSSDNHHHHHVASLGLGLTSKRQRRPSVRLGEIGDQSAALSYDSLRRAKQWGDSSKLRLPFQSKSSKTRALMNLSNGDGVESSEIEDVRVSGGAGDVVGGLDLLGIGSRKGRRGGMGTKRVRSNWAMNSKAEDGGIGVGDEKFSGEEGGMRGLGILIQRVQVVP
ncbi:hypothetical protein Syun_020162 [Stephania yunnanensis]|uniref:Uncharacterized protein n=1 Tax=Stephania yunnanensis TaxID=152371 RepID=A0AAP0NPQ9_9MAGN